jgi:hypothetical protein
MCVPFLLPLDFFFSTSLKTFGCQELTLIDALTLLSLDCDNHNVIDPAHHQTPLAQLYSPAIIVLEE